MRFCEAFRVKAVSRLVHGSGFGEATCALCASRRARCFNAKADHDLARLSQPKIEYVAEPRSSLPS